VFFVPHGGSLVGFYGRDGFADMVGVKPDGNGFSGIVFNYVVRSESRVDEVLDEAKRAGGKILKPAAKLQWGGYGGTFADPDGYVWNIGYSAQGKDQPYAESLGTGDAHTRAEEPRLSVCGRGERASAGQPCCGRARHGSAGSDGDEAGTGRVRSWVTLRHRVPS
jgi:uncharacterized protein